MLENYKDVLTVAELKEILNYSSNTTIYKLLNEGVIKARKVRDGKWLIPKENVIHFLVDKNISSNYNDCNVDDTVNSRSVF